MPRRPQFVSAACLSAEGSAKACALCMLKVRAVAWRSRRSFIPQQVKMPSCVVATLYKTLKRAPRRSAFFRTQQDRLEDRENVALFLKVGEGWGLIRNLVFFLIG